jgi:hypothetical protein
MARSGKEAPSPSAGSIEMEWKCEGGGGVAVDGEEEEREKGGSTAAVVLGACF